MGFWYFMFIFSLLIPGSLIVLGKYFNTIANQKINKMVGYRTSMSMMNKETWKFAHLYCGNLWRIFGWVVLVLTIITMLLVIGKSENVIGITGLLIVAVQLAFMLASIILTEIALRKRFDRDGKLKFDA